VPWGNAEHVHALVRKTTDKNPSYQEQMNALFTVGRMIREKIIEPYQYWEIECERLRGAPEIQEFNALRGCEVKRCDPALQRSKFRKTVNLVDIFSKGGRKDVKKGIELGQANQIAFFEWLRTLQREHIELLISHAEVIKLTEFEINSLRDIEYFQFLCNRSGSRENYPDVFHLWTAKRNNLDAFLTLESALPELVSRIRSEKSKTPEIVAKVLQPLDLLKALGIDKPDLVPIDFDRFYHLHEL
jgi:hypothetical protein